MRIETIALLLPEPGQIGNCLPSIDVLRRLPARIQIVLLGTKAPCDCNHTLCRLQALQAAGIECFADAPNEEILACGFQVLEPDRIARLLTGADMVIAL